MSKLTRGQQIEAELAKVRGNAEIINPADVLAYAQANKDSILHECFEWDDGKAGHEYRLWQARKLISLHIITAEGERKTVSLTVDRVAGGGYRQIDDVVRVPVLREKMLADAMNELRRVRTKYNQLSELAKVFEEIDTVERQINTDRVA